MVFLGGHVLSETGIRRLGSKENGFFYRYPGTGETVNEKRVLARIENLKVPPAWEEARIARSPSAKVQAVGYDPAERVLAAMTRLMNAAYFRVGDERYARKNKTYGIATLRRKHLRIEGDAMIFEYSGKWGKTHRKVVTEGRLREVVEECVGLPGYEVFKYVDESGRVRDVKSRDLNTYVKQVMGDEFTPKDFRTWAGTLIATVKLAEVGPVTEPKHANKNVLEAVDAVAERLGNTRDIARASYISPRVIDHYLEGSVVAYHAEHLDEIIAAEHGDLTDGEKALLDLLNKKLRREMRRVA